MLQIFVFTVADEIDHKHHPLYTRPDASLPKSTSHECICVMDVGLDVWPSNTSPRTYSPQFATKRYHEVSSSAVSVGLYIDDVLRSSLLYKSNNKQQQVVEKQRTHLVSHLSCMSMLVEVACVMWHPQRGGCTQGPHWGSGWRGRLLDPVYGHVVEVHWGHA